VAASSHGDGQARFAPKNLQMPNTIPLKPAAPGDAPFPINTFRYWQYQLPANVSRELAETAFLALYCAEASAAVGLIQSIGDDDDGMKKIICGNTDILSVWAATITQLSAQNKASIDEAIGRVFQHRRNPFAFRVNSERYRNVVAQTAIGTALQRGSYVPIIVEGMKQGKWYNGNHFVCLARDDLHELADAILDEVRMATVTASESGIKPSDANRATTKLGADDKRAAGKKSRKPRKNTDIERNEWIRAQKGTDKHVLKLFKAMKASTHDYWKNINDEERIRQIRAKDPKKT
jgi:hypothetical protein